MSLEETQRPTTLPELEQLVAWAMTEERSVEVLGAGSKAGLGHPVDAKLRISTAGLSGVDMYEPEELVMSAGAGTPMATIEAMLVERQQELGFEPGDFGALLGAEPGKQTIGGVFAANISGPRRLRGGAARDHLLGVTCVTGRGQVMKTGGRVVKNVTGYDLCKLLAGSFGTLAIMSRVTFRVVPAAETVATLLVMDLPEADLLACLRVAMGTAYDVSGAAMLPMLAAGRSAVEAVHRRGRAIACLRLEGPEPSVEYRLARLQEALQRPGASFDTIGKDGSRSLWAEIRDVRLIAAERPLWRLSMAPTAASELAEWLAGMSPERLFDWSGGLIWLAPNSTWALEAALIRKALDGRGGHATLVRAPKEMREMVPVFEPQPPALRALAARVKSSFDPKGILNPGRMAGAGA